MTDYRYAAGMSQRWRRIALPLTSDQNVNAFIDRLMRERPNGENFGRAKSNGGWTEKSTGKRHNLSAAPELKDLLTEKGKKGIQITGHAPPGRRFKRPADLIPHGKPSSYTNLKCRCDQCRAAWAEYARTRYQKKAINN